jgi:ribosomal protein S18 acetylase RimI-like enzyme
MSQKSHKTRRYKDFIYRTENDPAVLLTYLSEIRALADADKEALGFLPEAAYREAVEKRRLIAMLAESDGVTLVAGFVLFSGVFPNARIQQVVVKPDHRRRRLGSRLVNSVVAQLEVSGYMGITAAVADELSVAQGFYEANGFRERRAKPGGLARGRTIILRARDLETENLFSVLEPSGDASPSTIDLGLRLRGARPAPLYAIDLNVMFDVVKDRRQPRSEAARRLIAAALAHQIRFAIAPEFIVELERTTKEADADPVLQLARQLPRLPIVDRGQVQPLADTIHTIVFVEPHSPQAHTPQALSDARHLAEAALAGASGYVTSDGHMLAARDALLRQIGIDVASLDEFDALLPTALGSSSDAQLQGTDCVIRPTSVDLIRNYLEAQQVTASVIAEFGPEASLFGAWTAHSVTEGGQIVAIGVRIMSASIDAPVRVLVHVRPDHVWCDIFADHLLDAEVREACNSGPTTIQLLSVAGQAPVRRAAILRGFIPAPRTDTLIKVALGRPVTSASWPAIARQTRRKTGLRLPEAPPDSEAVRQGVIVHGPDGKAVTVRLAALEDAIGPTLLIWPGRTGVVVPITRNYADDLLGTSDQLVLFGRPEAAFVTRRAYFNSPRAAGQMRPGAPLLFYESRRSGGRGAIIAVARIIDATILPKQQVPDDLLRRAVVEDLEPLSASTDVLATSFDNLLRFPKFVSLDNLRALGATGPANLQTTTVLSHAALTAILELGWTRA